MRLARLVTMPRFAGRLLAAVAMVGFVLTMAEHARAENKRICVEISLQRSAQKAAARPKAPAAADAARAPEEADNTGVITPGSDADVLPPDVASKLRAGEALPLGQRQLAYLKRL